MSSGVQSSDHNRTSVSVFRTVVHLSSRHSRVRFMHCGLTTHYLSYPPSPTSSQSDRITTKSVVHVLRCIRQLACRTDCGHTKPQHLRSSHSPAVPPIPRPTEPSNIHPDQRVLFLSSDLVVTLDVRLRALTYCIVKDYERTDHDRFTQGYLSVHRRFIAPDQTPPRYIQTREKLIGKSSITILLSLESTF